MSGSPKLRGLQIESRLITPKGRNFRPDTWPPPKDFPVVINERGDVVTRFGDLVWDFSPWHEKSLRFSFGDSSTRGRTVDSANADLFRLIAGHWLWGPSACTSPRTLVGNLGLIKCIFSVCTEAGLVASDLWRFPKVIDRVSESVAPSRVSNFLSLVEDIWSSRDLIGFTIFDEAGLSQLKSLAPERVTNQTPYIPPRIWTYQVNRLRECLDDYLAHKDAVEQCFRFCVSAYSRNVGGLQSLERSPIPQSRAPFHPSHAFRGDTGYAEFFGPFYLTARRFGIDALLDRWVNANRKNGVVSLTSYLSLISQVGMVYTINFSLMRLEEGNQLRANCYSQDTDDLANDIHMISGVTTKTMHDFDAKWIVSPTVKVAIDAMISVANLRLGVSKEYSESKWAHQDFTNPTLQQWTYEPWAFRTSVSCPYKVPLAYSTIWKSWPKLFDSEQLRITKDDLAIASRITFGLDVEQFAVGKIWPIGVHQLRRTGAVNMLSSGLVSDASLQYQLKHASRAMTRYYGQNYYHLNGRLDDETRRLYLREMYQSLVRSFEDLHSERFVSPYGQKRKDQILNPMAERDHDLLIRDGKAGKIAYKKNFLGGCAKLGTPCPFGGITNVSACMGFSRNKPCSDLLIDTSKKNLLLDLLGVLRERLEAAEPGSPLHESISAQIESIERALNVIASAKN